jgi:hypothetical protein
MAMPPPHHIEMAAAATAAAGLEPWVCFFSIPIFYLNFLFTSRRLELPQ